MFTPPFCPNRSCPQHTSPGVRFFARHGHYRSKCRPHPVPRFYCKTCRRGFSRQTFRADYRDHRPHLNAALFLLIASGVGIRQSSRTLKLSRRCTELKLRKLGRHARRLNLNLRRRLEGPTARFHLDEFETYEVERNTRPLSVPVLIESVTRYIVWAEAAPIRARGRMSKKRRAAIERADRLHGPRKDTSRRSLERTLARGSDLAKTASAVVLSSDEKSSYPGLAKRAFDGRKLIHRKTNSRVVRDTRNPLFAINHEEAIMRDLMGRVRRDSWLVSKKRRYLDHGLQIHMAYRNLVRRRFNRDVASPAQLLGFVPRRLTPQECLSWRQDHGMRSISPLSSRGNARVSLEGARPTAHTHASQFRNLGGGGGRT